MKIKIKDKELELHYSMRIYMIYENIMGKSLDPTSMNSYTSLLVLFYSTLMATFQYNHENLELDYNEFLDWIDEQGMPIITGFSEWFIKQVQVSTQLTREKKETHKPSKKSKNS